MHFKLFNIFMSTMNLFSGLVHMYRKLIAVEIGNVKNPCKENASRVKPYE